MVNLLLKTIKNFEVEVDVQKGALRFGGKIDNRCVSLIQCMSSSIVIICNSPHSLPYPFLLGLAFEFLGFCNLVAHKASLEFRSLDCG